MKEKDLRKLNRYQLLELLILQTERADKLQAKLELAEQQLTKQVFQISSLGSIAEASVHVTGIFQTAQETADMYLDGARKKAAAIIAEAEEKARQISSEKTDEMIYE